MANEDQDLSAEATVSILKFDIANEDKLLQTLSLLIFQNNKRTLSHDPKHKFSLKQEMV